MTVYSAVLFLHVLSAIALFIAFLFEGVIFIRIRSARSIEQARFFTRAFSRLWVIYVPSFVGILVGGKYLEPHLARRTTLQSQPPPHAPMSKVNRFAIH